MSHRAQLGPILWYEGAGFCLIIACIWAGQFFFANIPAAVLLSLATLVIAAVVMLLTHRKLSQSDSEAEMYISCAWCKKLKMEEDWVPLDQFFRDKFADVTTHGICHSCEQQAKNELQAAKARVAGNGK
jgi:cell division protein FtsW (lipid II flippase)